MILITLTEIHYLLLKLEVPNVAHHNCDVLTLFLIVGITIQLSNCYYFIRIIVSTIIHTLGVVIKQNVEFNISYCTSYKTQNSTIVYTYLKEIPDMVYSTFDNMKSGII